MSRSIRAGDTFVLDTDPKCKCGNYATNFMELHRVNDCVPDATVGSFVCTVCLTNHIKRIGQLTARSRAVHGVRCKTCDLGIVAVSDMIVRLTSLDK